MHENNKITTIQLPGNFPLCVWRQNLGNLSDIQFSGSVEQLTGYTSDEILSLPEKFHSIVFPDDIKLVKESLFELNKKNNVTIQFRIYNKDKNIVWVSEKIVKIGEFYFGTILNVDEFIKIQSKLNEEIETLKKKNDSKDKFISIISHDLRSPFTSILGFTEILINEPDLSEDERNEYLRYVNESSQNLLGLINHLLDWGRIQTGKIVASNSRINTSTIIYDTISSLTGVAVRKNIEIKNSAKNNLYAFADESLTSKILTNLIDNAIKFSKPSSQIEIIVNKFNNQKIEFIIKDEGVGISNENMAKISAGKVFSMNGTNDEKGTGIGIPIVKEILKMHNSEMWIYTEEGKGTEVHFTLPAFPNTVLLVDDNPENQESLKNLINNRLPDYNFISVSNFYEAAFVIAGTPPSLIVMKHKLSLMNGIEFIKFVKKNFSGYFIPVIVLSNPENEVMSAYYSLNIHAFSNPVIEPDSFYEEINNILN